MAGPVRKSPRMSFFDYASSNYYFVTICTHEKKCIFGSVQNRSRYGQIAADSIVQISAHYSSVAVDKYVVMPNHVHMILVIGCENRNEKNPSLEQIIGAYKSGVSRMIYKTGEKFPVWQRSFHDHVIRNQKDYERIWAYIDTNPMRWETDCFYYGE
ncbi:MAG: transposase [Oscillospiraceae bacterium]|nr:transposase [Oscillospiraceae bacterium]